MLLYNIAECSIAENVLMQLHTTTGIIHGLHASSAAEHHAAIGQDVMPCLLVTKKIQRKATLRHPIAIITL